MKAAVLHQFGETPRYEDFPDPQAGGFGIEFWFVPFGVLSLYEGVLPSSKATFFLCFTATFLPSWVWVWFLNRPWVVLAASSWSCQESCPFDRLASCQSVFLVP